MNLCTITVRRSDLTLMRWKTEGGHTEKLYLMKRISFKWRDIGDLLGMPSSEMAKLSLKHHEDPVLCCQEVLDKWLHNPPCEYPATWEGLMELLEDSNLSSVASELRNVLGKATSLSPVLPVGPSSHTEGDIFSSELCV